MPYSYDETATQLIEHEVWILNKGTKNVVNIYFPDRKLATMHLGSVARTTSSENWTSFCLKFKILQLHTLINTYLNDRFLEIIKPVQTNSKSS